MKLFQCAVRRQSERDGRVNSEGLFLAVCRAPPGGYSRAAKESRAQEAAFKLVELERAVAYARG